MNTPRRIMWLMAMAAACLFTGCIEFERQTMSYRHDPATDTLYIFQDYQGIFGADDPGNLSESELDQIGSVMRGGRTFFFNNWITEFNRAQLIETLEKPKGELDANPEYESAIRNLIELALANVEVQNIGFYRNGQGRLCGSQRVTVKNASKIVAALNKMMPFFLREQAAKDDTSEQQRKQILQFAASGQNTVRLDGNQVEIRWPALEEEYTKLKGQEPHAGAFRDSGGGITYDDGILVLTVGKKDAATVSITLPFSEHTYSDNCLAQAKVYGIKDTFDPSAAAKAFLEASSSSSGKPE